MLTALSLQLARSVSKLCISGTGAHHSHFAKTSVSFSRMSAADQGAGPRSGESPASDMPAVATDNSSPTNDQAEMRRQHEQEEFSHSTDAQANIKPVPPARPTGNLQDMDTNDLVTKRNQILWEQAVKGQQPGLTLMKDRLTGENKQETWGNEDTILEPEKQN